MHPTIEFFQYFAMSIIILSCANFIYFATQNLIDQKYNNNNYIHLCLKTSLISMTAAIIYVVKLICYASSSSELKFILIVGSFATFSIFLVSILVYKTISLKQITPQNLLFKLEYNLILTIILYTVQLLDLITIHTLFVISFSLFVIIAINFSYQIIYIKRVYCNTGVYFILLSALLLTLINLLSHHLPLNVIVIFNLGLDCLIIYGLFVFYTQYFVEALTKAYLSETEKINALSALSSKLSDMVYEDSITGIKNELALINDLELISEPISLISINIRNFSLYNQILGFSQGNQLLRQIAHALTEVSYQQVLCSSQIYKLHSDKYIVLCKSSDDHMSLNYINQIKQMFADNSFMNFKLDAYYGVSSLNKIERSSSNVNDLIGAVELAAKQAKLVHEKLFFLTLERYENEKKKFDIEYQLKIALEQKLFEIYFQPQVSSHSKEVCSYEALIRWYHNGKFIPPAIFIPIAENSGLITEVTHFVISNVFHNIFTLKWNDNKKVSINLSAIQLVENGFVEFVKDILLSYPIDTSQIVFEVTETALTYDLKKVEETICALKSIGFEFSLDDFGTGYSSLNRLSKLKFDEVKFDKFFIQDLSSDEKLRITFSKTVELFNLLNLRIVVEGVETLDQQAFLDQYPIDVYQGYLYSEAQPLKQLITF